VQHAITTILCLGAKVIAQHVNLQMLPLAIFAISVIKYPVFAIEGVLLEISLT